MKILIVTSIFPPDIGGPATYLPVLADGLIARGHQLRVLALGRIRNERAEHRAYPVDRIDRVQPDRFLKMVRGMLSTRYEGDLLFVNGFLPEVLFVRSALRVPVVAKVVGDAAWERAVRTHGTTDDIDTFQRKRYGARIECWKFLRNLWLKNMDSIITPSDYLKSMVMGWGGRRIFVIHNAVSYQSSKQSGDYSQTLSKQSFNILYAGRLTIHKRVDQLIDVLTDFPEATLTVLGDGEEKRKLINMAERLGVTRRIRFLEPCPQNHINQVLKSHHCLALNSIYEGFPHIILEAQSAGTPVLATATGGARELIQHGENGWLIDPQDGVAGLLRGLRELSGSVGLRKHLAHNGKASAAKFSTKAMVEATEAIFAKTIQRRRMLS
jgi:glycosyltransferase involved in cell wall biosynthesis